MSTSVSVGRIPNLEDVAALAQVSRATVSRVVNRQATVAPELRDRVEKAIEQLGYVPNQAARSLMTRRSDTLALLASETDERVFGDPFFAGVTRGITLEANRAGLQVIMLMASTDADRARAMRYLRSSGVDGVMLISEHASSDSLPSELERLGMPFVLGGRPLSTAQKILYVDNDNLLGGELAARHLRSIGRKVIGTLTGPQDMGAGIDRLTGFKAGLGRSFRPRRVEYGDFTQRGADPAVVRLLERVPDLDGLFAASDLMALGAIAALRRAGRRVPDDVAVVGFDDNVFAEDADPPLTTVRQDPVLQGRMMVRLYLTRHRPDVELPPDDSGVELAGADHVLLPVQLVVRESA